jgi:superoxide dismutase, Fe-Mn family
MLLLCVVTLSFSVGFVSTEVQPPYHLISVQADTYILPLLTYPLDGLEPYIDRPTVVAHYQGHHDNYRKKMNAVLARWREKEPENSFNKDPIFHILNRLRHVPEEYKVDITNNVGGFINHALYWGVLSPNPKGKDRAPTGDLLTELEQTFGGFFAFKILFSHEAVELFGSGYVWLVRDRKLKPGKQLSIVVSKNQASPISQDLDPLLVIDVWEHSYYLKHQYKRLNYVTDWWMLVDWDYVDKLDKFWNKIRYPNKDEL